MAARYSPEGEPEWPRSAAGAEEYLLAHMVTSRPSVKYPRPASVTWSSLCELIGRCISNRKWAARRVVLVARMRELPCI